MDLEQLINEDLKKAMLAKDQQKLEAIRAIKAAILLEKTKEGTTGEVTRDSELKLLQKLVKQRKESAEIYQSAKRSDLADKELFEASIIETYLPKQISEEEITAVIKTIISDTGASSIKDMGKVMGLATRELAGKADNKKVSDIVKQLLSA
ncbi:MAG: GatB/YqeY domain-containing protein [Bacteroidota bacterium]|nr:GatB/YqeY domain-containing protein [Bacteroidota bacterium]